MSPKSLRIRDRGFTIIEVLIVLAIAALILLIVFLAVPALQRNSRNTSRARDAADIVASINEYVSDNSSLPLGCTPTTPSSTITWTGPAGTTSTNTNLSYYTQGCQAYNGTYPSGPLSSAYIFLVALTVPTYSGAGIGPVTQDALVIAEQAQCGPGTSSTTTARQGSTRQFVVMYEIENGPGSLAQECLSS